MRLELAACLDAERDDVQRAARVELGEPAASGDGIAITVQVACAADGIDAGVVIDVRPPDSARRYRYALDLRAQPGNARARLIALAVAEAVDASRIELTAVAEQPPPPVGAPARFTLPARPPPVSAWAIALVAGQRSFSPRGGVGLLGAGLAPTRRLSPHLHLAADVIAEGATVLTTSGVVVVRSLSSGVRVAYRTGGRIHGEVGLGARAGAVHMRGDALPLSQLVGSTFTRVWLGPAAIGALGVDLTPRLAVAATIELGVVAAGATARDLGEPVAAVDGAWTSFGLAAAIAL